MRGHGGRRARRVLIGLVATALASAGCGDAGSSAPPSQGNRNGPTPSPLEFSGESEFGHYTIAVRPAETPIPLNRIHDWIVHIERKEGSTRVPSAIQFDGGMPSHGHGFVTQPQVTQNLGEGEFLVEGVKFHMPGAWVVNVVVISADGNDQITLPLELEPR